MEEQIISVETAELAKLHGFSIRRATQSLLQKWLREVHGIDISIDVYLEEEGSSVKEYAPSVLSGIFEGDEEDNDLLYPTYEEALEAALQTALESIE